MDMSKGLDTYRSKDIKTPLLLLFTTFKETSLRSSINNNTIEYWSLLRPWVQPLLFVENNYPNNSLAKHAKERGWLVYRAPTLRKGIPILRDMFLRAEQLVKPTTKYIAYANSDILFKMDLVETLLMLSVEPESSAIQKLNKSILIIGTRKRFLLDDLIKTNAPINHKYSLNNLDASPVTRSDPKAVDYFITLRNQFPWERVPDFVVGKPGYDNWLPTKCWDWDIASIDVSLTVTALHQVVEKCNPEGGWASADVCMNRDLVDPFDFSRGRTVCTEFYTKKKYSTNRVGSYNNSVATLQLRTRNKDYYIRNECIKPDSLTFGQRFKGFFSFKHKPLTCQQTAKYKRTHEC